MKVNNISHKSTQPNYKSTNILKYKSTLENYNTNSIGKIADIIGDKFIHSPKQTKIFDFGCADGTFAYALAINLIDKFKQAADKFFPIIAIDKDKNIIEYAKQRFLNLKPIDQTSIKPSVCGMGIGLEEYLEYINTNISTYDIKKESEQKDLSYYEILAQRLNKREECKSRFLEGEFFVQYQYDEFFGLQSKKIITDKDKLLDHFDTFYVKPPLSQKVEFSQKDILEATDEILKEIENSENVFKQELQAWATNEKIEFNKNDLIDILKHYPKDELEEFAFYTDFNTTSSNENIKIDELAEWVIMNLKDKGENLTSWLSEQITSLISTDNAKENKVIIFKNILDFELHLKRNCDTETIKAQEKQNDKIIKNIIKTLNSGDILVLGDAEQKELKKSIPSKNFLELAPNVYEIKDA